MVCLQHASCLNYAASAIISIQPTIPLHIYARHHCWVSTVPKRSFSCAPRVVQNTGNRTDAQGLVHFMLGQQDGARTGDAARAWRAFRDPQRWQHRAVLWPGTRGCERDGRICCFRPECYRHRHLRALRLWRNESDRHLRLPGPYACGEELAAPCRCGTDDQRVTRPSNGTGADRRHGTRQRCRTAQ